MFLEYKLFCISEQYSSCGRNDFYKKLDKNFSFQYNDLIEGMNSNYEKRNITIIEYTDFYESYRTSLLQLIA